MEVNLLISIQVNSWQIFRKTNQLLTILLPSKYIFVLKQKIKMIQKSLENNLLRPGNEIMNEIVHDWKYLDSDKRQVYKDKADIGEINT